MVGNVMFYGPGAGKLPTASAVSADIVDAAAHIEGGLKLPEYTVATPADVADFSSYTCKRMFIFDKCDGCTPDEKKAEHIFGKIEKLISCDKCGKVALITEKLSEVEADSILKKIKNGKSYRLL